MKFLKLKFSKLKFPRLKFPKLKIFFIFAKHYFIITNSITIFSRFHQNGSKTMRFQFLLGLAASRIIEVFEEHASPPPPKDCDNLAPAIRKDCGMDAAQHAIMRQNVTKSDLRLDIQTCEIFNCCWDITTYSRFAVKDYIPLCFYPANWAEPGGATMVLAEIQVEEKPEIIYIEEIILVKKPSKLAPKPEVQPTLNPIVTVSVTVPEVTGVAVQNEKPVEHGDLVLSYRKKTCQQIDQSTALNVTMKEVTMNKMKCGSVDFRNYDAASDTNLQQSSENGMKILMEKFKEAKNDPTIIAGDMTAIINDHNPTANLLEEKIQKMMKKEQLKSTTCKKTEAEFARKKKSSFSSKEEKQLEEACGRVPNGKCLLLFFQNIFFSQFPSFILSK